MTDVSACISYAVQEYNCTSPEAIDHHCMKSWLGELISSGIGARSIRRKISSLNTYFKYLLRHQLTGTNPMDRVSSPKMSHRLPVFIEEKKMEEILSEVHAKKKDEETTLAEDILLTLYHTGIRLSELIHLEKRHISLHEPGIRVLGKRNKERIIPVTDELQEVLLPYLDKNPDSPYVFNTPAGKKLYPNFVYRAVKDLLSSQTTLRKKSPHILRHSFATHLLNQGGDLNAIKELLGHANLSATQVYTHNSVERLRNIYKQAHPKGKADNKKQ